MKITINLPEREREKKRFSEKNRQSYILWINNQSSMTHKAAGIERTHQELPSVSIMTYRNSDEFKNT